MNDLMLGAVMIGFALLQLVTSHLQERARKQLEQVAKQHDGQAWIRAERDLKIIQRCFLLLYFGFCMPAYYWRLQAPTRDESYVFMAMVFGLQVGNTAWQSWVYVKLAKPLKDEFRRLALKFAFTSGVFNLASIGFLFTVFTQLKK